jgi:hypothetical protein
MVCAMLISILILFCLHTFLIFQLTPQNQSLVHICPILLRHNVSPWGMAREPSETHPGSLVAGLYDWGFTHNDWYHLGQHAAWRVTA